MNTHLKRKGTKKPPRNPSDASTEMKDADSALDLIEAAIGSFTLVRHAILAYIEYDRQRQP